VHAGLVVAEVEEELRSVDEAQAAPVRAVIIGGQQQPVVAHHEVPPAGAVGRLLPKDQ